MKMFAILRREAVESAIGARLDEEVCLDREEASAVEDGQCAIDRRRGLEIRRNAQQASWRSSRNVPRGCTATVKTWSRTTGMRARKPEVGYGSSVRQSGVAKSVTRS